MFKTYLLLLLVGAVFAQEVLDSGEDQFEASASEQDLMVAETKAAGGGAVRIPLLFPISKIH